MENWISDSVGMFGALMVVLAYFLLQLERVQSESLSYSLINLIGALCLLFSLCFTFNLASFVIELFWITASLIGLWKYWRRRNNAGHASS